MEKIKVITGVISENTNSDWQILSGLTVLAINLYGVSDKLLILRPIELNEMETFYTALYKSFGKEYFFDNYSYFVCYASDEENEDITLMINKNELTNCKEATKDILEKHTQNLSLLRNQHNWNTYKQH